MKIDRLRPKYWCLQVSFIDFDRLIDLLGFENYDDLKDAHYKWVDSAMHTDNSDKENKWTQSIAVGSKTFIEKMKEALGFRATGRKIICALTIPLNFGKC